MKKTILLLFVLITHIGIYAQIVTEKTRDEAYLAPNTKITSITWYDNKGTICKFYPNGTLSVETNVSADTDLYEGKMTIKGRWTRANKLYFDLTFDFNSAIIQLKNKGLSERKFEEVKEAVKPVLSETRKKGVMAGKNKIGRLDNYYFVLIETDERHQKESNNPFVLKSQAQLQKEKTEEVTKAKQEEARFKAEILSEIGKVPRELESKEVPTELEGVDDDQIFDKIEEQPEFPGGNNALMQFLSKNIMYPSIAQENGVQGRVIVQFVVNKDGSIVDPFVARSVDPFLDKEAIRVVSLMPKWKPGKHHGKPVRCRFTMPVTFKLQ